jgi:hypothetical protein
MGPRSVATCFADSKSEAALHSIREQLNILLLSLNMLLRLVGYLTLLTWSQLGEKQAQNSGESSAKTSWLTRKSYAKIIEVLPSFDA